MFGIFLERGGGLLNSKEFEEPFCFCLENFQKEGGDDLIPKMMRNSICFSLDIFKVKLGRMTKNQTLSRNLSL